MPFLDEYFQLFEDIPSFHDRVAQKYSPGAASVSISERLLRCVWYDRLYDERQLVTAKGKMIVVHSPGTWNLEGGPDFRRADITIGDSRFKGDVELHLDPAGWRLHRHGYDPNYNNVILHVTLTARPDEPPPISGHGVEIPQVALWDYLTDDLKVLKCALRPDEYPYQSTQNFGRCRAQFEQMPSEATQRLLCIAGDARMVVKQRRFAYETERSDVDQVAYSALLEGMGYKAHTKQFGQLAQKLPYGRLRDRVASAEKIHSDGSVFLTQALLLGAAGLLPESRSESSPEVMEYIKTIRRSWDRYGFVDLETGDIKWKRSAVRPANLPQRRIAGVSHTLTRSYEKGVLGSILDRILTEDPKKARAGCMDYLTQAEDDFWLHRYSVHSERFSKPVSLVGRDRALTIMVNSFVPLGLLHTRKEKRPHEEDRVHRFFCDLPSPSQNNITRLMEYKMFGSSGKKRVARSARTQQGLLQIFADWCSEDPSCESCGILAALQDGLFGNTFANSG